MAIKLAIATGVLLLCLPMATRAGGIGHGFAVGAHYFYVLGDIDADHDFDDDGLGYNVSYRMCLSRIFALDVGLQSYPSGYYQAEEVWSPEIYAVLGRSIYAGLGALAYRVTWRKPFRDDPGNEREWTDFTYALIGGIELPLILETVTLDINARYVFSDWQEVEEFAEDTLTFGGRLRIYINRP